MNRTYTWETPEEIIADLADRVRRIRKRKNISQEKLSEMSGVSYGSIKRFERSGHISLISLTRLAVALDMSEEIKSLFTDVGYSNIEEVIREST